MRMTACALAALGLAAAPAAGAERFAVQEVVINDVIGRIEVVTSERADVEVSIEPGAGAAPAPKAGLAGAAVMIDGPDGPFTSINCTNRNGVLMVQVGRGGYRPVGDFPLVRVAAPKNARLTLKGGAAFAKIGDLGEADIGVDSCGDVLLGDVAGKASLAVAGSGDLIAGRLGSASLAVAGSGDIVTGAVRDGLKASLAGSGDITVEAAHGALHLSIAGSGDIDAGHGEASSFKAAIAGSGDINYRGRAQNPVISLVGSGGVRLAAMEGDLTVRRLGSGEVDIGG